MSVYRAEINSPKGEPVIVLAADTVVVSVVGEILEKPRSEKDHFAVLKSLRDAEQHKVYTAVVCMSPREDATHPGYAIKTLVEVSIFNSFISFTSLTVRLQETTVRFDPNGTSSMLIIAKYTY